MGLDVTYKFEYSGPGCASANLAVRSASPDRRDAVQSCCKYVIQMDDDPLHFIQMDDDPLHFWTSAACAVVTP